MLRNEAKKMEQAHTRGYREGHEAASKATSQEAVDQARDELRKLQDDLRAKDRETLWAKQEHERLRHSVLAFEKAAGLEPGALSTYGNMQYLGEKKLGAQWKAARLLADMAPDFLAEQFEAVANALRGLPKTEDR
jgi:hypothetical protein